MNKVELFGRLTKDPEVRYYDGADGTQSAVAHASIAVSRKNKTEKGPEADFFDIRCFGKMAEAFTKYFHKGSRICITGRIQNNNWTDQNGGKHYGTLIIVEDWDFVDTKAESEAKSQGKPDAAPDDFLNVPDGIENDLPFR